MSDADNLEIKKRARRRLVGAAALALLAAVVLPMMMDQEPRPVSQDIQVSIPDRDADSALSRPIGSTEQAATDAVASPPEEVPATSAVPDEPAAKAPPGPVPAEVPRSAARVESRPEVKPPVKSDVRSDPKPEPKVEPKPAKPVPPEAAAAEAARARAALGGEEPAPRRDAYVVQVGAFGDAEKAARIAAELKKQGFAAYTERAGSVTRVRIGAPDGRDAAEKMAARLKAQGYSPAVSPR
ncbi:MAG: SPOR domain-containing protein [Proteobacteria bacterium]|nr:SPOR domain-containing protein [Pseudomonadota bacterium]